MTVFHYLKRDQLDRIPDLAPMIDGVLDKGTVVALAAQPAAGKSFLAIDWACSYAAGRPWQGHDVDNTVTYPDDQPARGQALFIAAEGARGLKRRVNAWEQAWRTTVPTDQFIVLPQPVQLGRPDEVAMLCDDLQRTSAGLVVIDTVARCSLGLEENSATDMGRVVDAAYRIREAMGPDGTVLLVHHLGKNGVVRGSSALLGGVDQLMTLQRDGHDLVLADEKRKDGLELTPMSLRLKPVHDSLIIESGVPDHDRPNPLVDLMRRGVNHLLPMSKTDLKVASGLGDREFFTHLNRGIDAGHITSTNEKNPRFTVTFNEGSSTENAHNYGPTA